jgi:amino acid adenylation domain-containing protein
MRTDKSNSTAVSGSSQKAAEKDYWLSRFSGEPVKTTFPYDCPKEPSGEGEKLAAPVRFEFPGDMFEKAMKISNHSDLRLHIILVAGVVILLKKYTGSCDITVGMPIYKPEGEMGEGEFINTVLALRNTVEDRQTFKEVLLSVSRGIFEANENQNYPLEKLLFNLHMPFSKDDFPLFDVAVLLENIQDRAHISHINTGVLFSFQESGGKLEGKIEFDADRYKRSTIEKIANHLLNLLGCAFFDINIAVSDLEILSGEEKQRFLFDFNDTEMEYPAEKALHELFESQVTGTPDSIALVAHELHGLYERRKTQVHVTYRELNRKADQLAHLLREKGVKPDTIVGIIIEPTVEMITGLLGILKSGGAYLPIDPDYPGDRVEFILEDSGVSLVITRQQLGEQLKYKGEIIRFEDKEICEKSGAHPGPAGNPGSLAYIIYTSGSTGAPKGVAIEHRNIVAYLSAFFNRFDLCGRDVSLQQYSYSFDAFVEEVYPLLLRGGKVAIPDRNTVMDIDSLAGYIIRSSITFISCSPLMLNELNKRDEKYNIHTFISGGDMLKEEYIDTLMQTGEVYNTYGPTETTVCAAYFKCRPGMGANVPIGKPIANYKLYVLDRNNRLLPVGVAGELCIGGKGTARGYLKREQLTAEKFIENPFLPGERLYKSADLARWREDGNLEFLGRLDNQIKLRGFRIEPGEIEHRLVKHHQVRDAIVIAREDGETGKYLCAYFVSGEEIGGPELKEFLLETLPNYMIPTHFVRMEQFPLDAHGKVNRKELPVPDFPGEGENYRAPRNEIEERLTAIWQEVLGVERIGIDDNFFEMGGQSLLAMKVISKMNRVFDGKIEIIDLFRVGTVRGIAEIIQGVGSVADTGQNTGTCRLIRPFDMGRPPLVRVGVVRLPGNRSLVYLDMHRILAEQEGVSIETIKGEFFRLCAPGGKAVKEHTV